jgi:hypothetical protein
VKLSWPRLPEKRKWRRTKRRSSDRRLRRSEAPERGPEGGTVLRNGGFELGQEGGRHSSSLCHRLISPRTPLPNSLREFGASAEEKIKRIGATAWAAGPQRRNYKSVVTPNAFQIITLRFNFLLFLIIIFFNHLPSITSDDVTDSLSVLAMRPGTCCIWISDTETLDPSMKKHKTNCIIVRQCRDNVREILQYFGHEMFGHCTDEKISSIPLHMAVGWETPPLNISVPSTEGPSGNLLPHYLYTSYRISNMSSQYKFIKK